MKKVQHEKINCYSKIWKKKVYKKGADNGPSVDGPLYTGFEKRKRLTRKNGKV